MGGIALVFVTLLARSVPKPPPLDPNIPIHRHWTIGYARAVLIHHGWKPVARNKPFNRDYPEREDVCAVGRNVPGENLTFCLFDYKKAGRCLQVETVGEFTMRVSWWTHACPSNLDTP
jgi:hypothetical protein